MKTGSLDRMLAILATLAASTVACTGSNSTPGTFQSWKSRTSSGGTTIQPTRQPVIEKYFEKLLITMAEPETSAADGFFDLLDVLDERDRALEAIMKLLDDMGEIGFLSARTELDTSP